MTFQELISLYILQKNYHSHPDDSLFAQAFINKFDDIMTNVSVVRSDNLATPLFDDQPHIPFVLLKPEQATITHPMPVIIHTHGGPNVYFDKNTRHAEIAWFLAKGYVVACPNYRGSCDYPVGGEKKETWLQWQSLAQDHYHRYGPEDVVCVTQQVKKLPYIDENKIFLRGGSFGSYINAALLAGIKQGIYPSIYAGVHLSGGLNYPPSSLLPDDIPLLITHGLQDDIAPVNHACQLIKQRLLERFINRLKGASNSPLFVFLAQYGNHHLIQPDLRLTNYNSPAYLEMTSYLSLSTGFIDKLAHNQPLPLCDEFKILTTIISRYNAEQADTLIEQYLFISQQIISNMARSEYLGLPKRDYTGQDSPTIHGPTKALLRLYCGKNSTGTVKHDLSWFLKHRFKPLDWETRQPLQNAGVDIIKNDTILDQFTQMIHQEELFLKQHPDYTVLYHAAPNRALKLYSFINLWLAILKGQSIERLDCINEMRLYDYPKRSFNHVRVFLKTMRDKRREDDDIFNNMPGFSERMLACNPALLSNSHTTASCSLWWYYKAMELERVPVEHQIHQFLYLLGLRLPPCYERYLALFKKYSEKPQALMQQIFLPKKVADKSAYVCQLWGEELNAGHHSLSKPSSIEQLINNPESFELYLRQNHHYFFDNLGDCENYGDTTNGFMYSGLLQCRYFPQDHPEIKTYSYFRAPSKHHQFIQELAALIKEDFADYLINGYTIPNFIVEGARSYRNQLAANRFQFFSRPPTTSHLTHLLFQADLARGLLKSQPHHYHDELMQVSPFDKRRMQQLIKELFREKKITHCRQVYPYSLCIYLQGYSYFDLLCEASISLSCDTALIKRCAALIGGSDMSQPIDIPRQTYDALNTLFYTISRFSFNPEKHPIVLSDSDDSIADDLVFRAELNRGINSFLRQLHPSNQNECSATTPYLNIHEQQINASRPA